MGGRKKRKVYYGMWKRFDSAELAEEVAVMLKERHCPFQAQCACQMADVPLEERNHKPNEYCPGGVYIRVKLGWEMALGEAISKAKTGMNRVVVETTTE